MKYALVLLAMLSANVVAQEIVLVEYDKKAYAIVTTCSTNTRIKQVRIQEPKKGSAVIIRTAKGKNHRCTIKKAVQVT